jgi:catechol 2,3-dioxygenase-like lactoylglutathione lyase family enzyme
MHRLRWLVPVLATSLAGCGAATMGPEADRAPRLYRVILQVGDIERASGFYADLLGLPGERVSPGRHYFDCGGAILALLEPGADGDAGGARPMPDHVYLSVPDLQAAFARAQRLGGLSAETGDGGLPMGRIAVRPWGERSFYLHDPWGNPLCFVEAGTEFTGR